MVSVADVLALVERLAPPEFAFSFDKIGLQVGDPSATVDSMVVSLDPSLECIRYIQQTGSKLLLSHHPVIWDPLSSVSFDQPVGQLLANGISFIAAHTNWDCARGGINDVLASKLHLTNITDFGEASQSSTYKLIVYVPRDHVTAVLDSLAENGAGTIGDYTACSFQVDGTGRFTPGEQSDPVVGTPGVPHAEPESRVETVVPEAKISQVLSRLIEVHPYEEPAFDLVPLKSTGGQQAGRIGELSAPVSLDNFRDHVDATLNTRSMAWRGHDRAIQKVAVVGGAAADHWTYALHFGADVFITGEVPHHVSIQAAAAGVNIIAAGHFATENPGMQEMANLLRQTLAIPVHFFEPESGAAGNPK